MRHMMFQQVLVVRDPATGGACKLEALWLANDPALVLQRNGKQLLDVIGEVSSRTSFQPKLDQGYQQVGWPLFFLYISFRLLVPVASFVGLYVFRVFHICLLIWAAQFPSRPFVSFFHSQEASRVSLFYLRLLLPPFAPRPFSLSFPFLPHSTCTCLLSFRILSWPSSFPSSSLFLFGFAVAVASSSGSLCLSLYCLASLLSSGLLYPFPVSFPRRSLYSPFPPSADCLFLGCCCSRGCLRFV